MNEVDDAVAQLHASLSPTASDKQRVRLALNAAVAGSVVTGAAVAKGAAAPGRKLLEALGLGSKTAASTKLVAALVVGASLTGGAIWLTMSPRTSVVRGTHAAPLPAVVAAPDSVAVESRAPHDPTPSVEAHELARAVPPPAARVQSLPSASAKTQVRPSSLEAEAKLISEASRALRGGNGAQALKVLAEHGKRYPTGALAQERQGLRALALCAAGQVEAAREAGRHYLKQAPSSPLAVYVKKGCQ